MADQGADDWVAGPDDWVPPDGSRSLQDQTSAIGSFGRGVVRGAAPAVGGLGAGVAGAEAGATLGSMAGPVGTLAGGLIGGLAGAYGGSELTQKAQDYATSMIPDKWRRAAGFGDEREKADISQHPYATMAGELAPNLALLRPGAIAKTVPEGAGLIRRAVQSPAAARAAGATLMGGQEAATEESQTGQVDPAKVAIAAGAGAIMNRPTRAGEAVISGATAPQRVLTNIARGWPADTPTATPQQADDWAPEGQTAAAATPSTAPGVGEPVGVRFKNGPPQRAEVDHYFDNGNAVRLRMDDGSMRDLTTADLLRTRTDAPEPMPRPTEIQGKPPAQLGMEEAPFPDDWYEPPNQPRAPQTAPLGRDLFNALDHAVSLERTALNGSLNLSAASRQDMLTEAERLRRMVGKPGDAGTPPNAYRHPLANEPAADLGELAAARAANPDLYQGQYQPTQAPSAPGVDPYALADVHEARSPLPKGESLFDAIRRLGGIRDDGGGDLNQIMQGYRNEPFKRRVLNPNGEHPDKIREALQDEGWFGVQDLHGPEALETGSYYGDSTNDLYDLMDREVRGEKIYHPESDTAREIDYRRQLDQDLANAGVLHTDTAEDAARKLATYRDHERSLQDEYEQGQSVHEAISPEELEGLYTHDYSYEPGADAGAEHEEPQRHEKGAEGPEDWLPEQGQHPESGEQIAGAGEAPAEEFAGERTDIGHGVEQTVIPGGERSAQQLAAAREAQGHGRLAPKAEQREPGGLFEGPDKQQTLFQPGVQTGSHRGETVKLDDDLLGHTIGVPTPEEAHILNAVEKIANRIAPSATVRVMRGLQAGSKLKADTGMAPHLGISGVTYSNGLRRLIAVSLQSPDVAGTLGHEALHYLKGRGVITPKEWQTLEVAALRRGWLKKHDVDNRWPNASDALKREEAIAEEFSRWGRAPESVPKIFRPMYERIRRFIGQIGDAMRRMFGRDVTADDVMSRLASGEIGSRTGQPPYREEPTMVQPLPEGMDEAGDRRDQAADQMAETLRTSGPGTYQRTLDRMMPPMGELQFKDPNAVQNVTLRPETLARMDTRSAAIWNAEKAREYAANTMVDDLRSRISDTMLKLNDAQRRNVYAARELDRINGMMREDTGHQIVARNEGADYAHFSKPGSVVTLSPEETAAYHALTNMFDRAWKNIMEGAARKVGWSGAWDKEDMPQNIAAMNDAAENHPDRGTQKSAARAAKIVSASDEQRRTGYHPLMRFGDYYAHVTPKAGTDMSSTGGFPKTVRFEMAERGLMDDAFGATRKGNEVPRYAKEMLGRLNTQYPKDQFNIEHGFISKNSDMLDKVDIPAIEKLMTFMENDMMHGLRQEARARGLSREGAAADARKKYDDLYGAMVDKLWDKFYREMEAGYKKQSRTVPGWSDDFDRALGTYMHWTSRSVADQINREATDNAYTAMDTDPRVNRNVKQYWKNWRDYQRSPSNIFNKAANGMARWGFLTAMGVNPSSSAVVGTHGLFMAGPTLSVGVGMNKAGPAYFRALGHAMQAMKVDTGGLHIDDVAMAGRTPQEKALLTKLDQEGMLHSRAIYDMAALNEKQSSLWGSARSSARKIMDAALSNVAVMDRANRIASALSSYRLAQDPKTLSRMDRAWQQNQIWRERSSREGVSPESMSRFMLPNMVGEYGRANAMPFEQKFPATSRMVLGMQGFVTRLLGNMWKLGTMGPEGQKALLWTAAAFWTFAGLDGLPFAEDAQNLADFTWKKLADKDPMIGYRIQSELAHAFGKPGADLILHGPVSALTGADVGHRLGLGDVISRNWPSADNVLGAYPSIILGRAMAAASYARHGQPEMAAAQAFPGGIKNAIMAHAEAREGIRARSGRPVVPASQIGPTETVSRTLGFTPEKAEHSYQNTDYRIRARKARMAPPPNPIPTGYADGGRNRATLQTMRPRRAGSL